MNQKRLTNTPITYWTNDTDHNETILFVHAAFADHTMFNQQIDYFNNDYKIITLDLIGHGLSTEAQKDDGIEKTADYIHQLLDVEGIDKVHLVGVSIGAILSQDFANKYPQRVASLACIGGYDINNFDETLQKDNNSDQFKMIAKGMISIKWFAKSNKTISAYTPKAQEDFYQMNLRFKKSSFRYLAGLAGLINKQKSVPRDYPLLIAIGEKDAPLAIKASEMWHQNEPQSEFIVIKNAGHLANMDAPDSLNKLLEEFINHTK